MIENYKIFKNYLKIIQASEDKSDAFTEVLKYLLTNNNILLHNYYQGTSALPSFMLLKKLRNQLAYKSLLKTDIALNKYFDTIIILAKKFYYNLIRILHEHKTNTREFANHFEISAQPFGEQIINILISIKYEIRSLGIYSKVDSIITNSLFNNKWFDSIYKKTATIKSRVFALRSISSQVIDRLYIFSIIIIIVGAFLLHHKFDSWASKTYYSLYIDLMIGLSIIIAAISLYPFNSFGSVDIFGKNRVIYQYKMLFKTIKHR